MSKKFLTDIDLSNNNLLNPINLYTKVQGDARYALQTTTVNGHPLTAAITVSAADVGLGNLTNNTQTSAAIVPNTIPTAGQILVGNAGGTAYAPVSLSGDGTLSATGALAITKSGGVAFGTGAFATIANYVPITTTVNGHALSANVTVTNADVGLGSITNDAQVKRTEMGVANGVATLDVTGKVPTSQLPAAVLGANQFQTTWNAATNTPTLVSGTGTKGYFYKVSVSGSTTIDGISQWNAGDFIIFDGTTWDKIDGLASEVLSVAGRTGAVTLTTADVAATGNYQYVTAAQLVVVSNTSNTNTGDETAATIKTKLGITTLSGSNTGDQTITLTGDVTGSGTGSFAATIGTGTVTFAKMANLAANSFIGNNTGSAATPTALTAAQAKTILAITEADVTNLVSDLAGKVATSVTVNGHALTSNVVVSASDLTTGTLPHAQLPTLVSGDIPNNAANTTGTAQYATDVAGGAANQILYQTGPNATSYITTANSAVLMTNSSGVPSWIANAAARAAFGATAKYAVPIGNGALTTINVNHALNTIDYIIGIYEVATGLKVEADTQTVDANNISVIFATAPTSNQYRVVVIG